MTDDAEQVSQALAELWDIVRCRCHEAYTGRGLHDPDCQCDSTDALQIVTHCIKALTEQLAAARDDAKEAEAYAEELEADRKKTYEALLKVSRIHGEVEAKLTTCEKYRDAYAECDRIGTQAVRDLEAKLAIMMTERDEAWKRAAHAEKMWGEAEAKLAKAVEVIEWALISWDDHNKHGYNMQGDWVFDARATLVELKGESHA